MPIRSCAAILAAVLALAAAAETNTTAWRLDLAGTWSLSRAGGGSAAAVPMTVPGGVCDALLRAGQIPDPFFADNERRIQWVGDADWLAERTFVASTDLLGRASVVLRLEDVDTFCDLSLNGRPVGATGNRFRRYEFEVGPLLRPGTNVLSARFRSARRESSARAAALPWPVPMATNYFAPHLNLVRKPACDGGWDWGPALMDAGPMGRAELLGADHARIDYAWCETRLEPDLARVAVHVRVTSPRGGRVPFAVALGGESAARTATLRPGTNELAATLVIRSPKLWWPNGDGPQSLYPLRVTVGEATLARRTGLRTVELVNAPDPDGGGLSMAFRVNGADIFMKGANWIPCDAFAGRRTPEKIRGLLADAAAAHMNMVRLWGGGAFESDAFYEACDELGLLVWHDFMFACAAYPADPAFLGEVRAELRHQLPRLRDHPSIALWCGDNECYNALGWYDDSIASRDRYLVAYDRLNRLLADEAAALDPSRPFWPSSPSCSRASPADHPGTNDVIAAWHQHFGDMHFWTVWQEDRDLADFRSIVPRFCSEFGYQSLSSPEVAATYCLPGPLDPSAPDCAYHQKVPGGNAKILAALARNLPADPSAGLFYLSQVQQALAVRTAVEYWRARRPRCMGALYWQLDDCWPVASWSSIEYGGKWKQLHYQARRFYAPLAVFAAPVPAADGATNIEIRAVNDFAAAVDARVEIALWTFDGHVVRTEQLAAKLPPRSATLLASRPAAAFGDGRRRFLALRLVANTPDGRRTEFRADGLLAPFRDCALAPAHLEVTPSETDGGVFAATLRTDKPAFFVWADAAGIRGEFDDDSITLLPGRPVTLRFIPREPVTFARFRAALTVKGIRNRE